MMNASYEQLQQNPEDIRFQFEIIKGLGDSVRQQTAAMAEMQRVQIEIVERLARIEAKDHEVALAALRAEVEMLKADKLRRDGANGIIHAILRSPVIGWIVAAGGGIYYMLRDHS
jgi:hypothetical protein